MSAASRLRDAVSSFGAGLYRRALGPVRSWEERDAEEQQAILRLRENPDFPVLQDFFDERLRRLYEAWLAVGTDREILALHAKAQAVNKLISDLDSVLTAKERAEWSQKQIDLLTVDRLRRGDMVNRSRAKAAGAAQS